MNFRVSYQFNIHLLNSKINKNHLEYIFGKCCIWWVSRLYRRVQQPTVNNVWLINIPTMALFMSLLLCSPLYFLTRTIDKTCILKIIYITKIRINWTWTESIQPHCPQIPLIFTFFPYFYTCQALFLTVQRTSYPYLT